MKVNKPYKIFAILAAFVLAFVVGGCGVSGLGPTNPRVLFGDRGQRSPEASMFVPKQAPVMASLLVNPDELEEFVQQTPAGKNRPQVSRQLTQLKENFLAPTDINYSMDIQPWLGNEITFAMTTPDIDRDPQNGSQPGYLVAIASKDAQLSREFLQHFWETQPLIGHELVLEEYSGVQLIYSNAFETADLIPLSGGIRPLSGDWASAVVGDRFILFANHPKVLKEAINNVQATELNLQSYPAYQDAIAPLKTNQIGFTFINMPQLLGWLSDRPVFPPEELDEVLDLDTPKVYEHLAIAFGLKKQGLVAQVAGNLLNYSENTSQNTEVSPLPKPVTALKYIPDSVDILLAGSDLQQLWTNLEPTLSEEGVISALFNPPLAKFQQKVNLNLPEDIFNWVTGEYTLGIIGANTENPDWIFVAETAEMTDEGIANLETKARVQGFTTGSVNFENQPLSAWTKLTAAKVEAGGTLNLTAQVEGLHTTVGNYEIFASSINTMQAALKAANSQSMLQQETFSQAIAALTSPNYGYFYLDWPNAQTMLDREFPILQLLEIAGAPIFDNLGSLTFSAYQPESGYQRGNIFLHIKS
jgi:hypothetical protein